MKKVLITPRSYGRFNENIDEKWKEAHFEVIRERGPLAESKLIELIKDVDALLIGTDQLTKNILNHAQNLKIISKYGVGIDNIPVDYANQIGISVTNTPNVNHEAVADYTMGLMITTARSITSSSRKLKDGQWVSYVGTELYKKTLGILGFGAIGKAVAKRAKGFDMNLLIYDVIQDKELANKLEVTFASLPTVLQKSDFVSIHLPLLSQTKHLINYEAMKMMKRDAILINTARGGIVNEKDLYRALNEGLLGGVGMDVFEIEPPMKSPLLQLEQAVLTPHNAALSKEAIVRMTLKSTENIISFFKERE